MNEQNQAAATSYPLPIILPAKRRRGRPRKDGSSIAEKLTPQSPLVIIPAPETKKMIQLPVEAKEKDSDVEEMVGKMVSGVIDGCFDAGYFLTVRIGNSSTLLRGVIFQPGRFSPITAATDVVPQAKMYQRREIPVPILDQNNGIVPQPDKVVNQPVQTPVASEQVLHPKQTFSAYANQPSPFAVAQSGSVSNMSRSNSGLSSGGKMVGPTSLYEKFQSQSAPPPLENLRMVEQDEVMQVFEVSTQPQWSSSKVNADVPCSDHGTSGIQVSQTLGSTEPCFMAFGCDNLANAAASERQNVESRIEENKSGSYSEVRHNPILDQPQFVQQAPSVIGSESLVRAEVADKPQSESEFYKQSDPVHEHQDHDENSQALEAENKNTNFEFSQNLADGNTQAF